MTPSRLVLHLADDGDELIFELREGPTATREELAPGAVLDRDAKGTPLRVRLQGLKTRRTTNAFLAPMVRCGQTEPMTGPGGGKCFWFCLLPLEREDQVFHPTAGAGPTG